MSAENIRPQRGNTKETSNFIKKWEISKAGGYSIYINGVEWRQCPRGPHTVTNNNNFFMWQHYMEAVQSIPCVYIQSREACIHEGKEFYSELCCPPVQYCIILLCKHTDVFFSLSLIIIFLYPLHEMTTWIILLLLPLLCATPVAVNPLPFSHPYNTLACTDLLYTLSALVN